MSKEKINPRDIETWNLKSSSHTGGGGSGENNGSNPGGVGNGGNGGNGNNTDPERPGPVNGPAGFSLRNN